jgi:transcriptional regulator with XRE-family HTH domain
MNMERLIPLRQRMIGAMIRQSRMEAGMDLAALGQKMQMEAEKIEAFELGAEAIPLPELEIMIGILNRSMREFQDRRGPVGAWMLQQKAIEEIRVLPDEIQTFISNPINRPYLELALRLSKMDVNQLRAVAEGLLEITY